MTPTKMHTPLRALIAASLSLALTITPVSADSYQHDRNNGSDTAAFLTALLGIAAIGVMLKNKNDHDDDEPTVIYRPHPTPPKTPNPKTPPAKRKPTPHPALLLPGRCLHKYSTQFGGANYWSTSCLEEHFRYNRTLPTACKETVVSRDRYGRYVTRYVFDPTCLRNKGYKIAKR